MELKPPTRRIVTGHNAQGKVALFDGAVVPQQKSPGGNVVTPLWVTVETPVDLSGRLDRSETKTGVPPLSNGSIFRIVDFPPTTTGGAPVDHHKMLVGMGIDPATQGYSRHPNTHRTRSIDYAIVLDGEIDMLMDDTEIHEDRRRACATGHQSCVGEQRHEAVPHCVHPDRCKRASRVATRMDQVAPETSRGPIRAR